MKKLQDKVAIVVGGGGAIGRAIALKLSAEGARVVVIDMMQESADRVAHEITKLGGESSAYALDITCYDKVKETFDGIAGHFGRIDILVNSAGGSAREKMALYQELPIEVLDWMLDVNLNGPLYCIRAAVNHLIKQNYGKIVNISSIVALGGMSKCVDYAAAKGGIIAATKSLAIELGSYNINVNCVSPGKVQRSTDDIDQAAFAKQYTYLNRICTQDDIADMVLYLTLPESDYITGQNMVVDGGRSLGLKGS
ncbi:MAG TPA: dehydrogenase [Lentisphaeria bacterium]|nr:dehydrogenase [Lentisphaeria bacterium]